MVLIITPKPNLGAPAPDFILPGADGKTCRRQDFAGQVLVVVFTCNHCPYARAIWPRLIQLAEAYRARGVAFVTINPNDAEQYPEDSFDTMKERVGEWGITIPYLRDETQAVARAYGAVCTPDIFVHDTRHNLVYRGRFDDNWQDERKVTRHDLREALDALLNGTQLPSVQHPSMGCSIKWK